MRVLAHRIEVKVYKSDQLVLPRYTLRIHLIRHIILPMVQVTGGRDIEDSCHLADITHPANQLRFSVPS